MAKIIVDGNQPLDLGKKGLWIWGKRVARAALNSSVFLQKREFLLTIPQNGFAKI